MGAGRAIGLLLGVAADGALGHPKRGRPVYRFVQAARVLENRVYSPHPLAGAVHTAALAGGVVLLGVAAERFGRRGPVLQAATTAFATWAVLGGAGLAVEGTGLARNLETGDLDSARRALGTLDPRCTGDLTAIAISRASVETLAENTSDVVVSPLVWGAVAGVPGLFGSRALSLLRGMLAKQSAGHRRFGWVALRLDEAVHLLPTRVAAALTVAGAPVVGGDAGAAWRTWRRDTAVHPSPNAGRVEAAFAGALEIRLGGRTVYPHGVEEIPVLGDGRNPDAGHVTRAVELSRVVGWLAGVTAAVLAVLAGRRGR
ncbi:cobalamin biosynthesis protein [Amycolatopsis antarctica]|uniref:Cobalamin biosynthesis protein CobD n=1 Tax=Amycolatopsis antarctica TaxID=1854586 RepID=A0A263DAK0_9PSEU|nr:cobalamin biosynthesis protein [Amycolatopsis antarctica]OZM75199.1 cobalamin biosynthesis protein [Amycolatopsis antarctica]